MRAPIYKDDENRNEIIEEYGEKDPILKLYKDSYEHNCTANVHSHKFGFELDIEDKHEN